ncbi:MAG: DUF4097 family beta strand repeat-containing protein [Bacteroidota bacterium]|nr:DUF4097 family beta strand repeat-containing protein [Bacteroidota bacterium]
MKTKRIQLLVMCVILASALMFASDQGTPKPPKPPRQSSSHAGLATPTPSSSMQSRKEQTFTVGKGSSLEVSVSGCEILIKSSEKNEINVVVDGIDEEDMEYVKLTQSGDEVRVSYRPKWGDHSDGRFLITVPSQTKLDLRTSGGDIELQGNITGDVKGSTSGGNITIEKVKGMVNMSTSGGDVRTGDIDGKADLRTSGGNITLANVNGEASVNTSGGDIRIDKVAKKLDARTSGGDIEVGDIGGDASLSTAGGDVRVGKVSGSAFLRTAGGDLNLKGASGTVEAKTAGGDIDLKNITGSIEASTAGGNVNAELIPSGKGNSKLKTAGGDVRLSLPENAKATIEATIRLRDNWGSSSRKSKYEIRSDFKAESYEKDEDREEIRARYVINGGGETIILETVNGYIDIKKK